MKVAARIRITKVLAPDELALQIEAKMRNLGGAIGARAQRLVPKRTYALHDSIFTTTERTGQRIKTTVGATESYALFVERGTSRMGAQPYLRPALLQSKPGDLERTGTGIKTHGVTPYKTRRARARARARSTR